MFLALIVFGSLLFFVFSVYRYVESPTQVKSAKAAWLSDAKRCFLNEVDLEDWDDKEIDAYLEDLYKHFQKEGYTGKQAVKEDMSYWEK